jgi:dimethylamine monooxygenase subunit B
MTTPRYVAMRVQDIETLTPRIKQFTFIPIDNSPLPSFSGGSHISLRLNSSQATFNNAYSLIGSPDRTSCYQIAVQLAEQSKGGSSLLHSLEQANAEIMASLPSNSFPFVHTARRHVFIAGGIGITPFITFIEDANTARVPWELHYAVRCRQAAAFADRLQSSYPDHVRIYSSDEGDRLDSSTILQAQKLGTHVYICGPERLIKATSESALALGWLERYIHFEYFKSASAGEAFTAELTRSGKTIHIESGVTLLEALEAEGVEVSYGCRGGVCGACETVLLAGIADHRDHFLSEEAKNSGELIMPCVSRARSERLVLDL